ncbi:hypothetical protein [Aeromicrobium sp. UC242_57]|uniref:hypothetical protein n=1 Tax=Aeromicrobium sp. UC242_57 TaxID=3374624 RepID=UPI0037A14A3B
MEGRLEPRLRVAGGRPSGTYAFSFATDSLDRATPGATQPFGEGSVGVYRLPPLTDDASLAPLRLGLPVTVAAGDVSITGTAERGRTLTAESDVTWSASGIGTASSGTATAPGSTAPPDAPTRPTSSRTASTPPSRSRRCPILATRSTDRRSSLQPSRSSTPRRSTCTPPRVTGTPRVGARLAASAGTRTPTAAPFTHTYRWFRGTTPIPGATAAS